MNVLLRSASVLALAAAALAAHAVTYDAAADFSIGNGNPNGVWSYGYATTLTGTLTLDTATSTSGALQAWRGNLAGDGNPAVSKNTSNATVTNSTVTYLPNQMIMHPGPNGEYTTVRFAAPAAGTYNFSGSFIGQDSTTTDVHILSKGVSVFDGNINGYGSVAGFTSTATLALGQTIELRVGYGNGSFSNDSTGANLTITSQANPTPEPSALAALGLGSVVLLKRRKRA